MQNLRFQEVRRFKIAAETHLDAAGALLTTCSRNESSSRAHVVVYLSGYALECSLKAWLMSSTPLRKHTGTIAWFKIIKHDLDRLKG